VHVRLTTKPAGATVTVEGEAAARGITPLLLTLPRGNGVRHLILTAPGYARAVAEVTPDVDSRLHFDLDRAPARLTRRRPAHKPSASSPALSPSLPLLAAPAGIRDGDLD
jgi:hypothetical protein